MDTEQIVKGVRAMPITEALYALKAQGKHPMAEVVMDERTGSRVEQVVLNIGGVRYYFHGTKDKDGKRLEVRHEGDSYYVPFDGWAGSPDDLAPMH
jgi:hypothetical protein